MSTKNLCWVALFLAALLVLKSVMPHQDGSQFTTQDEQNRPIAKLNGAESFNDYWSRTQRRD